MTDERSRLLVVAGSKCIAACMSTCMPVVCAIDCHSVWFEFFLRSCNKHARSRQLGRRHSSKHFQMLCWALYTNLVNRLISSRAMDRNEKVRQLANLLYSNGCDGDLERIRTTGALTPSNNLRHRATRTRLQFVRDLDGRWFTYTKW